MYNVQVGRLRLQGGPGVSDRAPGDGMGRSASLTGRAGAGGRWSPPPATYPILWIRTEFALKSGTSTRLRVRSKPMSAGASTPSTTHAVVPSAPIE